MVASRVRPQVTDVASAFENVWTGHVASAVLRWCSEVSAALYFCYDASLMRQERSLLPRKRPHTTNAFPNSPRDTFSWFVMHSRTRKQSKDIADGGDMSHPAPVSTSLHHSLSFARQPQEEIIKSVSSPW